MELTTQEIKSLLTEAQNYEAVLDSFEITYEKHTLRRTTPFGDEVIVEEVLLPNIKITYK